MLFEEKEELLNRIAMLEARLTEIRTGRRTLLYLLERLEKDKRQQIYHLETENKRLKLKNYQLVRCLYKEKEKTSFIKN